MHAKLLHRLQLSTPLWTVACQALLSMRILQARIAEWVAMPISRGSSDPGIEPGVKFPALIGGFLTVSAPWEA